MSVRHPFQQIAPGKIRKYLVPHVIVLMLVWTVGPLIFPYPDFGRLTQLVLAGDVVRAQAIIDTLSESDRLRIAFWGGFDFLVDVVAFDATALACIWAARVLRGPLAAVGDVLAWMCWLGIVLNIPENLGFIRMTIVVVQAPWPLVSALAGYLRLAFFAAGVFYVAAAALAPRSRRSAAGPVPRLDPAVGRRGR